MSSLIEVYRNRHLLASSIKNDLKARYAGQILGRGWIVLSPLILLSIYTVVYVYIFKLRPAQMAPMQYVLYIFSGLIPFLSIAESLNSGTQSITSNVAVLKNITFPVVIIPIKSVLVAHLPLAVSLVVIISMDAFYSQLTVHLFFIPIIIFLQIIFLMGLAFALSLLNVIIKDTSNFITYLVMLVMIASPIAYTADMVPEHLRVFLKLNPFAYFFEMYQSVIALNRLPDVNTVAIATTLSIFSFVVGERFFIKAKRIVLNYV